MNITTIIIPVFNNLSYTKDCLESIYQSTQLNSFKIIVINNASTDGTHEYLKSLKNKYTNFEFIQNQTNLGFAKANNQAAKLAETEKILFLNNDTKVTKGWLDNLIKAIESEDQIKIAGSKLLYEDSTIQHAGIVISDSLENNKKIIYHLYLFFAEQHFAVNKQRYFQCITGACLLTYRDFFLDIDGFSEEYINGFEDIDLCLKAGEKGAKILYCRESIVYHFESKTPGRHNHTLENTKLFYSKWQNKLVADDYKYFQEDQFKLLEVKREWQESESYLADKTKVILKQEILNVVFEKNFDSPKSLIISKNSNQQDILQLQMNTIEQFKLIVLSRNNYKIDDIKLFHNLEVISYADFEPTNLVEIINKNKLENIIFLANNEINYAWDKNHKKFNQNELIDFLNRAISKKLVKDDLGFIEELIGFIDNIEFLLLLNELYILNKQYQQSIKILQQELIKSPSNKKILEAMIITLTHLGDYSSAEKIKKIVKIDS